MAQDNPHGAQVTMTSRLHRASGARHPWTVEPGVVVDLPVTLDFTISDQDTGQLYSVTEATIDLRDGVPVLVRVTVDAPGGIDIAWTQRAFRWSGPIEVVTRLVPAMIRSGQDPFGAQFPIRDLPAVTRPAAQRRLSRAFLEDVALQYLTLGPGYAQTLAIQYQVTPRTVVSWVEKARRRGVLTPTRPGRHGGRLVAAAGAPSDAAASDAVVGYPSQSPPTTTPGSAPGWRSLVVRSLGFVLSSQAAFGSRASVT